MSMSHQGNMYHLHAKRFRLLAKEYHLRDNDQKLKNRLRNGRDLPKDISFGE